jgi:hypothetical protein
MTYSRINSWSLFRCITVRVMNLRIAETQVRHGDRIKGKMGEWSFRLTGQSGGGLLVIALEAGASSVKPVVADKVDPVAEVSAQAEVLADSRASKLTIQDISSAQFGENLEAVSEP